MSHHFSLNIKDKSVITIGSSRDLLDDMIPEGLRVIVISDANIDRLYGSLLARYETILIGVGETNKTFNTVQNICHQLVELGADRNTFLLGIGGGIVTDITGFVAAIYMRGIKFGFVSTTLLSQVDAGVGGKNGINFDGYKNMIGTFLQPEFVICDISMLSTLPLREFRAGWAEIIKVAIIADKELFEILESVDFDNIKDNSELLSHIIFRSIKIKADIVEQDEHEAGERRKLNLGHTFGHAIEKNSTEMNHGEAVAVGTLIATHVARRLDLINDNDVDRIESLLLRFGFNLESPVVMSKMLKAIVHDKKAIEGSIGMAFPTSIGSSIVKKMTIEEVTELVK